MPASIACELSTTRVMAVLPLPLPSLVRPVGLVWSRGRPLSPSARLLRDCLRKVAQKHFEATDQRRQLSRPFGE